MIARRTVGTAICVVVTVAAALAGCTDDGGTSGTTTTTTAPAEATTSTTSTTIPADPAQAAYVAQVNPICAQRNEQIIAAAKSNTVPDAAGALAKRARFSIEAVDQIRAVTPPPGAEAEVASMLAAMDQVNTSTADLATAVLYADADAGRVAIAAIKEQLPPLNDQLVQYGLVDCILEPPTG